AFTVTIDSSNDTLDGIKAAINAASDNTGVTATVINVDSGSRLVLTSDKTGTADSLSITAGTVTTALGLTDVAAAADAKFLVDGNLVTSASNTVTGVIEGVTLELNALAATGVTDTLTVARDLSAVKANVQAFVDKYNSLRGTLGFLSKDKLGGDSTLRGIESQFRTVLNTSPTGLTTTMGFLSEIGITTQRSGDLVLDQTVLDTALADDFTGVAELLADDDQGYAFRLEALADDMLGIDGTIDVREDGINARISRIGEDIAGYEFRLTQTEARLRKQFGALDGLLAGLTATGNFLSAQLGNLPRPRT
ncbi:MAG: flagellar filament capping protein FliD, partial [Gammaproteobacteria bacterium]|nr:flagellar filament capping protein FliD [Gammaproteobacteria bacterium]